MGIVKMTTLQARKRSDLHHALEEYKKKLSKENRRIVRIVDATAMIKPARMEHYFVLQKMVFHKAVNNERRE